MPRAKWEHVERFKRPYLPLPEQRAIARILGTLDDKIELNRRMNETLEAMAQALFKSWFVDFDPVVVNALRAGNPIPEKFAERAAHYRNNPGALGLPEEILRLFPARFVDSVLGPIPEGWGVGPLNDFFSVGLGGAWGEGEPSARATVAVRCLRGIDCHDLAEGRIPDVPVRWLSPKQVADRELMEGAILIEGSGSFCGRSMIWRRGYEALLGAPVGYSNFCKRLDPGCTPAQAAICWMQIRQAYRDGMLQSFRTGTAFPNFDVHGFLSNLIVVVPPLPLAEAFGEIFALSQRLDLMAQSRTLTALRDALLPRLISGELRVPDVEKMLEDAV
jgi:type I restriction enzyme S subunit